MLTVFCFMGPISTLVTFNTKRRLVRVSGSLMNATFPENSSSCGWVWLLAATGKLREVEAKLGSWGGSDGALAALALEDDLPHERVEAAPGPHHEQPHDDRDGPGGDGGALVILAGDGFPPAKDLPPGVHLLGQQAQHQHGDRQDVHARLEPHAGGVLTSRSRRR